MENEKRQIDANALERLRYTHIVQFWDGKLLKSLPLSEAPTVNAVEVVHGRWLLSVPGYRLCSHCMADVAIYSGHRNYCPNCGAKMDGDGNG